MSCRMSARWLGSLSMPWLRQKKLSKTRAGSLQILNNEKLLYVLSVLFDIISITFWQGVCLGSGIGNFDEIYDTVVAYDKGVSTACLSSIYHAHKP